MQLLQFKQFITQLYLSIILIFEMAQINPYQSIENIIKLPKMHNAKLNGNLFTPLKPQEIKDQVPQTLIIKTNQLVNELNQSFQVFQNPKNFIFSFPESIFPDVPEGESNTMSYEQKIIVQQEDTFKNRLSEEQLLDIKEKGQFKVKSNIEYITLPYVWKINQSLFWGSQRRQIVWKKSMSTIFGFYCEAKGLLLTKIPQLFIGIKKIPFKIFRLLFGAKSLTKLVSVDYDRQIFKDFWKKIIEQQYSISQEWSSALWSYLYVYYDPQLRRPAQTEDQTKQKQKRKDQQQIKIYQSAGKVQKMRKVDNQFSVQWGKMKKKVFLDLSNQFSPENSNKSLSGLRSSRSQSEQGLFASQNEDKKDEQILQKLNQQKFTLYVDHLQKKLPQNNVPIDVVNAIVFLLRLFRIISKRSQKNTRLLNRQRAKIQAKIKKQHAIKSLYAPFFNNLVEQQYKKISKIINEQMFQSLKKDDELNKILHKGQIKTYIQYNRLRINWDTVLQSKKKQIPQYHGPQRIFYSNYFLLPPYQIIKHQQQNYMYKAYYTLKKQSDYLTVSTATNFWKFKLYVMRIKTWTYNSLVMLIGLAWKGPFGLRCLYGRNDFGFDMYIPDITKPQAVYQYRKTVIGVFLQVLQGVKQSRRRFEQTPDLGLLGKNVSRYFNYIQCYVFRFFIVGIIIVLVLYPIGIVVFSCLSIIFMFTFWAWMPITLMLTYLFNILFYQFENSRTYGVRFFPLFIVVFVIIRSLVVVILLTLNFILLMPLKSLFIFLFCFVQRCFRTLLDSLMLLIFTKVGRTPSRDTSIAKKISGPGMSKQFYMSINEQDVYVLVRAQLQKILLHKYNQIITAKIYQNKQKAHQLKNTILKCFTNQNYSNQMNIIAQNSNNLGHYYNIQYQRHMARYPRQPYRVRFTEQQIDNYFQNTLNIVKNFVVKNEIQKWIFNKYQLYEDMYDDLTRDLWMEIFGIGQQIFEPLQKLDVRFKLQDQYQYDEGFNQSMKMNVRKVMQSLEGEVVLSHHHEKRTSPFKHNLLNRQKSSENMNEIITWWERNSKLGVNLDLENIKSIFIPNLNIKEIIIIDKDARQAQIKANPTIVDL